VPVNQQLVKQLTESGAASWSSYTDRFSMLKYCSNALAIVLMSENPIVAGGTPDVAEKTPTPGLNCEPEVAVVAGHSLKFVKALEPDMPYWEIADHTEAAFTVVPAVVLLID